MKDNPFIYELEERLGKKISILSRQISEAGADVVEKKQILHDLKCKMVLCQKARERVDERIFNWNKYLRGERILGIFMYLLRKL